MTAVHAGGAVFEVAAVVFDKDGTLLDLDLSWGAAARVWIETAAAGDPLLVSSLDIVLGFDRASTRLIPDLPLAAGTIAGLEELTAAVLIDAGVSPAEVASRVSAAHRLAVERASGDVHPIGDVTAVVRRLHAAGLKLGLVTSDDRRAAEAALIALRIEHLIGQTVAGDDGVDPKPSPRPLLTIADRLGVPIGDILYVGDSQVDVEAGRAAGTAGVVVVGHPGEVSGRGADAVVASIDELRPEGGV